jgi:hypothetical protein
VLKITATGFGLIHNKGALKEDMLMVHISEIEGRVSQLGVRISRWFQAELRELQHILMDHEQIISVVPGRYFNGNALLVATDHRLLLIDKRTFFMNLEDIRYDMISETDFNSRVFDATLRIFTLNKQHRFTSVKYKHQLRDLTRYVQRRIMEVRQYQNSATPQTSLINVSAPERFPTGHPNQQPVLNQPSNDLQAPTHHSKFIGAAAIIGAHRPRSFTSGALSTRTSVFMGSNAPR